MDTSRHTVRNTSDHTAGHEADLVSPGAAPPAAAASADNADLRPLLRFVAAALPVGWVLLSVPLVTGAPLSPFVLGTLYLGLVLPTVLLTRRDPDASMRQLLRDTLRLPGPVWSLLPAAFLIPVSTYAAGTLLGRSVALNTGFVLNLALVNVLSSVLIVNLWEEMAWAGFVQRRLTARWGFAGGAVGTALLFTGIHLPLSLYAVDGVGDIAYNIVVMLASGVGMRLLIGAFDSWGHPSILALAVIHATFNASSELLDTDSDWIRYVITLTLGVLAWGLWQITTPAADARTSAGTNADAGTTPGPVTR